MIDKLRLAIENPELIIPYIRRRVFGQLLPPKGILLGVNDVCNARCKMCHLPIKQRPQEFEIAMFKKLVEEIKRYDTSISFKMTEPTLKRDIAEFIKICSENDLKSYINTNGFLLPAIAEKLVETGLSGIQVSIDDLEEKHDSIRRLNGCFKRAVEGIELIDKYRRQNNKKVQIVVNFTVTPDNYSDLYETFNFFQKKPIDLLKFIHLNFMIDEIPIKVNPDVLYRQIQMIKRKSKFPVYFFPEMTKEETNRYYKEKGFLERYTKCNTLSTHCYIDFNGNVRPHVRCVDTVFGNIKDEKFMDIWKGEKFQKFRELVRKHPLKECARCCGITTDRTQ